MRFMNGNSRRACRSGWKATVTVLHISGMNNNAQQEAQRVDQDVPLATFDLLARVVARRIERGPMLRGFEGPARRWIVTVCTMLPS